MGFYYGSSEPPPEEPKPGCLDVFLITRAMFGILLWPMVAITLVVVDAAIIIWAFATHPALALMPLALTAVAVWLLAKWEQRRNPPPGL